MRQARTERAEFLHEAAHSFSQLPGARIQLDYNDWQVILIESDQHHREKDEFIEAHIFGSFDANAIERMIQAHEIPPSHHSAIDVDIALELFNQRQASVE